MDPRPKALPLPLGDPRAVAVVALSRDQRRSRRKHPVRSRVVSMARFPKRELQRERDRLAREQAIGMGPLPERPRTRGECAEGARPCPFLTCVHHLYLDVSPKT